MKCRALIPNSALVPVVFLSPALPARSETGTLKWASSDSPSVHVLLCTRYFKNRCTFSFHIADIYCSRHYLNLIRSRLWLDEEICCHGNHFGNLARVRNISKAGQDFAFIFHRSIPHSTQKTGELENQLLVLFIYFHLIRCYLTKYDPLMQDKGLPQHDPFCSIWDRCTPVFFFNFIFPSNLW